MNKFNRFCIVGIPFIWLATSVVLLDRVQYLSAAMAFMLAFHTGELLLWKTGVSNTEEGR